MENETTSISAMVKLMDIGAILVRVFEGAMIPNRADKMNGDRVYVGYRYNR
jgi:hypothetical protein